MMIFSEQFSSYNPEGNRAYPLPSPPHPHDEWQFDSVDRGHSQNLPPEPQRVLDKPVVLCSGFDQLCREFEVIEESELASY